MMLMKILNYYSDKLNVQYWLDAKKYLMTKNRMHTKLLMVAEFIHS